MSPKHFPRRTFLRGLLGGAAVSIGMPLLDIMLDDNATALADGQALPRRFGIFYWGGGIVHDAWVPSSTGTGFALSESLQPFAALKPYVTLLTGARHAGSSPGHIPARGIALSASHDLDTSIEGVGTYRGQAHPEPSLDALVVEHWKGQTTFDSVEIGISAKGPYQGNSSWKRGGTAYNRHELSPQKLFDRLFGQSVAPVDDGLFAVTNKLEQSMLDAVMADAKDLQARVGAKDKQRLEQHLDGLRTIELRLQKIAAGGVASCSNPAVPVASDFGDGTSQEQKEDKSRIMSELLAVAIACDLSRVFSYEWSATQSHSVYWEVGVEQEHHPLNHDKPNGPEMRAVVQFIMKNFAYLAEQLRLKEEGDGNVLDRTLILGTSEHASAGNHDYEDHPFLFVGKAGGGLEAGQHVRLANADALSGSRALLTAVRAVGVQAKELGQADGDAQRRTSETISQLLA